MILGLIRAPDIHEVSAVATAKRARFRDNAVRLFCRAAADGIGSVSALSTRLNRLFIFLLKFNTRAQNVTTESKNGVRFVFRFRKTCVSKQWVEPTEKRNNIYIYTYMCVLIVKLLSF